MTNGQQGYSENMTSIAASSLIFRILKSSGVVTYRVGDLSDPPQYGFTASATNQVVGPKLLRISDIQNGHVDWDTVPFCLCPRPEKYLLQRNDIVFARTGGTTGKSYLIESCPESVFASYLIRLRVRRTVAAEYLYKYFQSADYWSAIMDDRQGTGQPNVNARKLVEIRVPVPQLEQQQEICQFLSAVEQRQRGDRSVMLPELSPPLSEVPGKVSDIEEFACKSREVQRLGKQVLDKVERLVPSTIFAVCYAKDFSVVSFGEVLLEAKNGIYKPSEYWGRGIPCVRMYNIDGPGMNTKRLQLLDVDADELTSYSCSPGDLVFNRVNSAELVGKTGLITYDYPICTFESKNMRLRIDRNRILPEYAAEILNSDQTHFYYRENLKQQCGMATLNQGHVREIPVPLPDLAEQRRIVDSLYHLRAGVDALRHMQGETADALETFLSSVVAKAVSQATIYHSN